MSHALSRSKPTDRQRHWNVPDSRQEAERRDQGADAEAEADTDTGAWLRVVFSVRDSGDEMTIGLS